MRFLDTGILLRYLTGDDVDKAEKKLLLCYCVLKKVKRKS
jgi:predicted nucleic acid-binding protein